MINVMIDLYIPGAAAVAACSFAQGRNVWKAIRTGAIWPVAVFKWLKETIKGILNTK